MIVCFPACLHLTAQNWYTPLPCTRARWLSHADLFAKRAWFDGALPSSSVDVGFPDKGPFANPAFNDGASSTSLMIQPKGVDKECSIAFAVTGWRPEAAVQECRASGDVGIDR